MNKENPFKLISSKEVYKNPWISVREDAVVRPGGKEGIFGVITIAPCSLTLPLTEDGYTYLAEEFKYGVGKQDIQIAGGVIDASETPLDAAKRELGEEVGVTASKWTDLSYVDSYTGVVNSKTHLFLAEGMSETKQDLDEGEVIKVRKILFTEVLAMVMGGEITHAPTCMAVLKVARLKGI